MTEAEATQFLSQILRTTGLGSYRAGDMLYATSAHTLGKLQAPPESSMVLHGGEVPAWAVVAMDELDGVLAPDQGGTGLSSYLLGDLLYASGPDTLATLAGQTTTTRKFLRQVGTGAESAAPVWDTLLAADTTDFDEAAQDAAASLIQNGTGISWSYNDVANTLTPTVSLASFSTSNLAEGSNLYFTDERAQDAISAALTDSTEIDFTYTDASNTISAALVSGSIAYAKLQNVSATSRILGRITAGAGTIEELTAANVATILSGITQSWSGAHTFTLAGTVGSATMLLSSTQPVFGFEETDQGTNEKKWSLAPVAKVLEWRSVNDAGNGSLVWMAVTRGTALAIANIAIGDATNNNTYTFGSNGLATFNGALLSKSSLRSDSATAGIGYATGAGGTVTQLTSRTTGVTINKVCGSITLVSAAGSTSYQTFTVTNSTVAATDTVDVVQKSGTDKYIILRTAVAAGSFEVTFATTGGTTVESPVFNFAVKKGVAA